MDRAWLSTPLRNATLVLILAAALLAPAAANAIMVRPTKQTCPVGGEVFDFTQVGSYTSFGERPDGRAYGMLASVPMPECPGNHLVMFRAFTPQEVERLKTLIETPAYRALIADGTTASRAAWLAQALGDSPVDVAIRIEIASWYADDQSEAKRRLQRDFATAVDGVDPGYLWLRAKGANAHRELGEFAIALAQAEIETRAMAAEDSTLKPADRPALAAYLRRLKIVIRRHDASAEPLDMIPDSIRRERCSALGSKRNAAQPPRICSKP